MNLGSDYVKQYVFFPSKKKHGLQSSSESVICLYLSSGRKRNKINTESSKCKRLKEGKTLRRRERAALPLEGFSDVPEGKKEGRKKQLKRTPVPH
jgi:hypothetical protein